MKIRHIRTVNDMNEYEKEHTCKFEGVYTPDEIELNKKLFEECQKEEIDFTIVEELLQQGADPIGPTAGEGWGLLEHIYGELICYYQEEIGENFSKLTELFLKYGMDVSKPRIPYDGENSSHPMWDFAFMYSEDSITALKMLFDNGLDADSYAECWGHDTFDLINIDCGDPINDDFWNEACTWTMKTIMLAASYDHILDNDEDLRKFIWFDYNAYDVHKFRQWEEFEYVFEQTKHQERSEFYRSLVRIYEKESKKEVWKIGICLKPEDI